MFGRGKTESPNPEFIKTGKLRNRFSNDPLTKQEVEQLGKVDNLRDYTLLLLGFYSGVRVGELCFDYNSIIWEESYVSIWMRKKTGTGKSIFLNRYSIA
jgi:hypothetical protein